MNFAYPTMFHEPEYSDGQLSPVMQNVRRSQTDYRQKKSKTKDANKIINNKQQLNTSRNNGSFLYDHSKQSTINYLSQNFSTHLPQYDSREEEEEELEVDVRRKEELQSKHRNNNQKLDATGSLIPLEKVVPIKKKEKTHDDRSHPHRHRNHHKIKDAHHKLASQIDKGEEELVAQQDLMPAPGTHHKSKQKGEKDSKTPHHHRHHHHQQHHDKRHHHRRTKSNENKMKEVNTTYANSPTLYAPLIKGNDPIEALNEKKPPQPYGLYEKEFSPIINSRQILDMHQYKTEENDNGDDDQFPSIIHKSPPMARYQPNIKIIENDDDKDKDSLLNLHEGSKINLAHLEEPTTTNDYIPRRSTSPSHVMQKDPLLTEPLEQQSPIGYNTIHLKTIGTQTAPDSITPTNIGAPTTTTNENVLFPLQKISIGLQTTQPQLLQQAPIENTDPENANKVHSFVQPIIRSPATPFTPPSSAPTNVCGPIASSPVLNTATIPRGIPGEDAFPMQQMRQTLPITKTEAGVPLAKVIRVDMPTNAYKLQISPKPSSPIINPVDRVPQKYEFSPVRIDNAEKFLQLPADVQAAVIHNMTGLQTIVPPATLESVKAKPQVQEHLAAFEKTKSTCYSDSSPADAAASLPVKLELDNPFFKDISSKLQQKQMENYRTQILQHPQLSQNPMFRNFQDEKPLLNINNTRVLAPVINSALQPSSPKDVVASPIKARAVTINPEIVPLQQPQLQKPQLQQPIRQLQQPQSQPPIRQLQQPQSQIRQPQQIPPPQPQPQLQQIPQLQQQQPQIRQPQQIPQPQLQQIPQPQLQQIPQPQLQQTPQAQPPIRQLQQQQPQIRQPPQPQPQLQQIPQLQQLQHPRQQPQQYLANIEPKILQNDQLQQPPSSDAKQPPTNVDTVSKDSKMQPSGSNNPFDDTSTTADIPAEEENQNLSIIREPLRTFAVSTYFRRPGLDGVMGKEELAQRDIGMFRVLESPELIEYEAFLTENECQKLIAIAETQTWTPVIQTTEELSLVENENNSPVMKTILPREHPLVKILENRAARCLGVNLEAISPIKAFKFSQGSEFFPQYDGPEAHRTLMLYLNNVEEGGETEMPNLGIAIAPKQGYGLSWINVLPDGACDTRTVHASLPVLQGTKYSLSVQTKQI